MFRSSKKTFDTFHQIDILVNNAAEQHPQPSFLDITSEQLEKTFRTNIFSMFYLTKAVIPHLKKGVLLLILPRLLVTKEMWI